MNLPDTYRGNEVAAPTPAMLAFQTAQATQSDRFAFGELFAIFRRRLLAFSCIAGICFLLGVIITQLMPATYLAYSDVMLAAEAATVTPDSMAGDPGDTLRKDDAVETEMQLIDSRTLAGKTIDTLNLLNDPAYRQEVLTPPSFVANAIRLATLGLWQPSPPAMSDAQLREKAITLLQNAVEPVRLGSSYAIRINVSASDPVRAKAIADMLAKIYVNTSVDAAADANRTAAGLLRTRLEELRRAAVADTNAVQIFRIQNNLLSNQATALTETEISQYDQAIASAHAQASEDGGLLASARSQLRTGTGKVGAASSPTVTALRAQRAQISVELAELTKRYRDNHPKVIQANSQLRDIDAQIDAEVNRTVAQLQSTAAASADRLAALQASRGQAIAQLAGSNKAIVGLTELENKAKTSEALYESYLARYNQLVAKGGTEQPSARLISTAILPVVPASPMWVLNLVLALMIGILLGIIAAIAIEMSYAGFTTRDDVEARLGLRYLSGVPDYASIDPHGGSGPDTVTSYPGGPYAEAMRQTLTSMRQASGSRDQVIAFTSSLPGEGKSTVAASFAHALALQHDRVVLVDCDFIRPSISRQFAKSTKAPGLQEVLDGAPIASAVVEIKNGPSLIPVTTAFPKGANLMEGGRLHRLIAKLREDYDFIILDCPPIVPIADVREMVTLADHVAIVTRWRGTTDKVVRSAVKLLPLNRLGDVGIILNKINLKRRFRFGDDEVVGFYAQNSQYFQ